MKPCQRLCISLLLVSDSYGHNHAAHKTATKTPETHKESFSVSHQLLVGRAVLWVSAGLTHVSAAVWCPLRPADLGWPQLG